MSFAEESHRPGGDEPPHDGAPSADHTLEEAAEAIIFAADEPVPAARIAEIVGEVTGNAQVSEEEVQAAVQRLSKEYEASDRALEIHEWGEGYRMATRSPLSPFVKTLFLGEQEKSLSRSLMETLAVVAYRQPVTRPEVDFIRGVNSDYAIRKLLEMELVDVQGRADSLGRPLLYETTPRFLEQFGLKDLEDLPTLREVEELLDDPAFDEERAKLLQLDAEEEVSIDTLTESAEEPPAAEEDVEHPPSNESDTADSPS
jgi:segregation and condensation protein B